MVKNILITGGCGFIGSHFVRHILLNKKEYNLFNVDCLSYAGDRKRLKDVENENRYHFIEGDIRKNDDLEKTFSCKIDIVVHFAAESHVDNSIDNPQLFEEVNVKGTLNLLDFSRRHKIEKFILVSTDEVYGDIKKGKFTERSLLSPSSPYSASKAAADLFAAAYMRTYSFPAIIVRCSNNYGSWQYPEKFIPVAIHKALKDEKVPVYGEGLNSREWMYVVDCAEAILLVLEKGQLGEIYNIGSGIEKKNIGVVRNILNILEKPETLINFVKDRPGHDFRYFLDSSKINNLGWKPRFSFQQGLEDTVKWYKENDWWVEEKTK